MDKNGSIHRNFDRPIIKDTVAVPFGGYTILRFRADNPGYWLLHCHILLHAEAGMSMVFKVGKESEFPKQPANWPQCSKSSFKMLNKSTNNYKKYSTSKFLYFLIFYIIYMISYH